MNWLQHKIMSSSPPFTVFYSFHPYRLSHFKTPAAIYKLHLARTVKTFFHHSIQQYGPNEKTTELKYDFSKYNLFLFDYVRLHYMHKAHVLKLK